HRICVGQLTVEARGGRMENLPNLLTAAAPTTAGHGRRGRTVAHRRAGAVAGFMVVLLVASCSHSTSGTATTGHTSTPTTARPPPRTSATATPTSSAPVSDEDQAKDTVKAFGDAYNSQNWEAYSELMCAAMRAQFTGIVMNYVKKGRVSNGPNTIKSVTVTIDG